MHLYRSRSYNRIHEASIGAESKVQLDTLAPSHARRKSRPKPLSRALHTFPLPLIPRSFNYIRTRNVFFERSCGGSRFRICRLIYGMLFCSDCALSCFRAFYYLTRSPLSPLFRPHTITCSFPQRMHYSLRLGTYCDSYRLKFTLTLEEHSQRDGAPLYPP